MARHPYREEDEEAGGSGGEASAASSNGWRVMWLREAYVKAQPGEARSVHQEALNTDMSKLERQKRYREALKVRMADDPAFANEFRAKTKQRQEKWREANPDKVRHANDYAKNRARIVASRAKHMDTRRANDAARRARRRAAGGSFCAADVRRLFSLQRSKCACCGVSIACGYHIDHVIPLASGGSNEPTNLQLLCRPCNLRKSSKHPIDFAQENGRLL